MTEVLLCTTYSKCVQFQIQVYATELNCGFGSKSSVMVYMKELQETAVPDTTVAENTLPVILLPKPHF